MGVLLKEVIEESSKIHTFCQDRKRRDEFYFDGVTVVRPQYEDTDGTKHDIDPNEALRRRITYECEVRVDVHHKTYTYAPDDEYMEGDDFETHHKVYRNIPSFTSRAWCDLASAIGTPPPTWIRRIWARTSLFRVTKRR